MSKMVKTLVDKTLGIQAVTQLFFSIHHTTEHYPDLILHSGNV